MARGKLVGIRMQPEDLDRLERLARSYAVPRSAVVKMLLKKAEETVEGHATLAVGEPESRRGILWLPVLVKGAVDAVRLEDVRRVRA